MAEPPSVPLLPAPTLREAWSRRCGGRARARRGGADVAAASRFRRCSASIEAAGVGAAAARPVRRALALEERTDSALLDADPRQRALADRYARRPT
jgi:hypothetical protein